MSGHIKPKKVLLLFWNNCDISWWGCNIQHRDIEGKNSEISEMTDDDDDYGDNHIMILILLYYNE